MTDRLRKLGIVMTVVGVVFAAVGVFAFTQVQAGSASLQAFSEAQNVTLSYNEDGQLIDRGQTEGADAIMDLLVNEWGFSVKDSELDPNDPLVNTASEYMFQMATVGYHTLHSTQTVVLAEDVEYNDELFPAGEYELSVREVGDRGELGGYWTDFDRSHPIEGPARSQAWSGTAHGLFGELGVGTVTASALQLGQGLSALIFGLGLTIMLLGVGMFWVGKGTEEDTYHVLVDSAPKPEPAGI
ncbi:MAG: hypothetical protein M3132_07145 [Actinomycetia bacterium]|nr:hypothetical protein [Actinomycetes bacterium]